MKKNCAIIGIGNPLRCDDGIGILLIKDIQDQKEKLPVDIDIIDGGTGGMNLLHILAKYKRVLIVDAVDFHSTPGNTGVFTVHELKQVIDIQQSTHEMTLLHVLQLCKNIDEHPDSLWIFGVQPEKLDYNQSISFSLLEKKASILKTLIETIHILSKEK